MKIHWIEGETCTCWKNATAANKKRELVAIQTMGIDKEYRRCEKCSDFVLGVLLKLKNKELDLLELNN